MDKAIFLLFIGVSIEASPTLPSEPSDPHATIPKPPSHHFQRRRRLPPISQVMMALQQQSLSSKLASTPTATPSLSHKPSSTPIALITATTVPYAGPGILILPDASLGAQETATAAPTSTIASMQANTSQDASHMSTTMRHLAVVGGAFAIIVFLVACCFFVMDPRVWKSCSISRKSKGRLARNQRFGQRPLPPWMRITPSLASPDRAFEKKAAPTLSPYPYTLSDALKSKFSMTTASDYSYCDDSFDTTISSAQLPMLPYNGHSHPPALTPPLPSYAASTDRAGRPETPPIRPPRPPTADSPATIESIYYADVDDPNFYRLPNPIVLEPNSPIINNPPPTSTTNDPKAQPHFNFLPASHQFFSSIALGIDALQRHNRTRSAPTLDAGSTSSKRLSGDSSVTHETVESANSECSQHTSRPQRNRASTSAVSWVRYSEFQQRHHIRLQQQSSGSNSSERRTSFQCPKLAKDRNEKVGSAH
ncbi:hypothetical protein NP233_g9881 [Leucocoprinus birnbaumii]|uniref:Uncharacterized protein n=1 Tax=Leucocoprinus birnbaumii TaxID=56174 RepID=A0AAD5VJD4_9AGAR|nr:hypothetical protein NP233_g9881 [Leucocoprinus birnbaumii]